MLPHPYLATDLSEAMELLASQPLAELLLANGILRQRAKELLVQRLRDSVSFTTEEEQVVLSRLWEGMPAPVATSL